MQQFNWFPALRLIGVKRAVVTIPAQPVRLAIDVLVRCSWVKLRQNKQPSCWIDENLDDSSALHVVGFGYAVAQLAVREVEKNWL